MRVRCEHHVQRLLAHVARGHWAQCSPVSGGPELAAEFADLGRACGSVMNSVGSLP